MLKLKIVEWQGRCQSLFCEVANIEGCVTILFEKTSNYPHFFLPPVRMIITLYKKK